MIALAWVLNMQQIKVEKTPEEYELSSLGRSEWQAVSLQKGPVGQVHTASCTGLPSEWTSWSGPHSQLHWRWGDCMTENMICTE